MSDTNTFCGASNSRVRASTLTQMITALKHVEGGENSHPGIQPEPLELPDVGGRGTNDENEADYYHSIAELNFVKGGFDKNKETSFRAYATGQPRLSYLRTSPPRLPTSTRRATIADIPEIDHRLVPHYVHLDGIRYLSLTTDVVKILTDFINGAKPVADLTVFKNLFVDHEMMVHHREQLLLTLAAIGPHCTGILLIDDLDLAENLGNAAQDWRGIPELLPNVNVVAFRACRDYRDD